MACGAAASCESGRPRRRSRRSYSAQLAQRQHDTSTQQSSVPAGHRRPQYAATRASAPSAQPADGTSARIDTGAATAVGSGFGPGQAAAGVTGSSGEGSKGGLGWPGWAIFPLCASKCHCDELDSELRVLLAPILCNFFVPQSSTMMVISSRWQIETSTICRC